VAELAVQDLGRRFPTRYVAVRFGIVFTGVRPGEKLFEELQYGGEAIDRFGPSLSIRRTTSWAFKGGTASGSPERLRSC
jgi:hypothetical protein